jgi:hypothetical protein
VPPVMMTLTCPSALCAWTALLPAPVVEMSWAAVTFTLPRPAFIALMPSPPAATLTAWLFVTKRLPVEPAFKNAAMMPLPLATSVMPLVTMVMSPVLALLNAALMPLPVEKMVADVISTSPPAPFDVATIPSPDAVANRAAARIVDAVADQLNRSHDLTDVHRAIVGHRDVAADERRLQADAESGDGDARIDRAYDLGREDVVAVVGPVRVVGGVGGDRIGKHGDEGRIYAADIDRHFRLFLSAPGPVKRARLRRAELAPREKHASNSGLREWLVGLYGPCCLWCPRLLLIPSQR